MKSNILPFELIFVDNNSKDNTLNLLEEIKKRYSDNFKITIIKNDKNYGFGKGINLGVKYAKGDYLLILNPDANIFSDTIQNMIMCFNIYKNLSVLEAMHIPYEHPKLYNPVNLKPIWCSGCCFMIKKKDFEDINGFDENIFLYGEDVEISWRLYLRGKQILYYPKCRVYHDDLQYKRSLHEIGRLSNFYIRGKYGFKIFPAIILIDAIEKLTLPKFSSIYNALKHYYKGKKNRIKEKSKLIEISFDDLDFGYEIFRRRGENIQLSHNLRMKSFPIVTVIVRTHNRPGLLRRALSTIINQTYDHIEIIIVEDKTNFGKEIMSKLSCLDNVKYFKTDKGRTNALNIGISNSIGEYILFLDDDDMLFCDAIEILVKGAIESKKNFVYGGAISFLTDDKIKGYLNYSYFEPFNKERIMITNYIPMGSFIISKNLVKKVGNFDEKLEALEDWDFIRRAAKLEDFHFIPKDILIYSVPLNPKIQIKRQKFLDSTYNYVISKDKQIHSRLKEI